ncbi:Ig-like domain repeat protein [Streptomyces sp. 8K308]|uniref:Ig-like domain-containing protein n=1 Tax=Streptomyces sp. 8K308 TaxID=2530388 RepID=UPI0010514077|nr:Ig-like domain-containing protein [Streptomyces sp. 8K308]TDC20739.1 Ig-like domain repeat protein [Streptomyces sp. 8K308]
MEPTLTTVTTSPDPSVFGQPVTLTGKVIRIFPGPNNPTGTVTFTVSGGPTLTAPVNGSSTATSALPPGTRTVQATYGGDANFSGSNGFTVQVVLKALTTTTVASAPDPSFIGQTATFTATVAPVSPGAGTPTGTVTFFISGGPTLTGVLNASGVATVTTSALSGGTHAVTAVYGGDAHFSPANGTDTHTVTSLAPTTTTVTSAPDPSVFGQPVTLTATVAPVPPASGTPTGTVTFVVAGGPTLTGTLNGSGVATVTTTALAVGTTR